MCEAPSPQSKTHPVDRPVAYSDKTACILTYIAGTSNVSNMIWAMRSRLYFGFPGLSVNNTGCSSGSTFSCVSITTVSVMYGSSQCDTDSHHIVKRMMPNYFHVLPIRDDTLGNRILQSQDIFQLLGIYSTKTKTMTENQPKNKLEIILEIINS